MKIKMSEETKRVLFWCYGCKSHHQVPFAPSKYNENCLWEFNGDMESPTLSPSLLTWTPIDGKRTEVCHLFIRNGVIEYLSDCEHEFAGKKMRMAEVEDYGKIRDGEIDIKTYIL